MRGMYSWLPSFQKRKNKQASPSKTKTSKPRK